MRIAQFIDTESQGGAERVVLDLCHFLQGQGHEVVALHFGSDYLRRQCTRLGIPDLVVPGHRYYKRTASLPRFAWIFQRFLRQQRIDALHSHLFGPVTGSAPAARLAGIPHVGTLHDVYSVAEKPARIRLIQLAALFGTRLVAVSRHMEGYYRSLAHFSDGVLRTIYNGISSMSGQGDPGSLRSQLGFGSHDLIIICVGRLVGLKRQDLLLKAFHGLAADYPARLLLVGDGPERSALERQVRALSLDGKVVFAGARDDVPQLLAMSDMFCLSSDTEGLSCSILEAMSAGLPVVATSVGGNSELIADGANGFLVPAGDASALRQRLQMLLQQPHMRKRFGDSGRMRAETLFSANANLPRYLELYEHEARLQT